MKKIFVLLIMILSLVSCAEKKRLIQKTQIGRAPAKLAILPSTNISNDILGGFVIRNLTYKKFQENYKGYEVQDIATTDSILISEGVSDGGLLNLFTPLELCQMLGVDGLLYIDIYDMGMKITPFYHSRYIDAQYREFNFSKLVWQRPIKIANRVMDIHGALNAISNIANGNLGDAFTDMAGNMAIQGLVKLGTATLFEHELKPEMLMVTDEMIVNMPYGSVNDMEYLESVHNNLIKLDKQKEKKEVLTFGDEEKVEEEEITITSKGINVF